MFIWPQRIGELQEGGVLPDCSSPLPPAHLFCVCQSALGGNQGLRLRLCFSVKAKFGNSAFKRDPKWDILFRGCTMSSQSQLGECLQAQGTCRPPFGEADHLGMGVAWATGSSQRQWSQYQPRGCVGGHCRLLG